jgi:hypothetical protein
MLLQVLFAAALRFRGSGTADAYTSPGFRTSNAMLPHQQPPRFPALLTIAY